jgi:Flp pilus assembly pilin Flp
MGERTLTEADIQALAETMTGVIKDHSVCNLGLTVDEVTILKRLIRVFDKATSIVGTVVLTFIAVALVAVFTKGFWISLYQGLKAAGLGK